MARVEVAVDPARGGSLGRRVVALGLSGVSVDEGNRDFHLSRGERSNLQEPAPEEGGASSEVGARGKGRVDELIKGRPGADLRIDRNGMEGPQKPAERFGKSSPFFIRPPQATGGNARNQRISRENV